MNLFGRILWSEYFWLPENFTWNNVTVYTEDHGTFMAVWDCLYAAFFLSVLRLSISSFFVHVGLSFGIKKPTTKIVNDIPILDAIFRKTRYPEKERLKELGKILKVDERMIEIWFKNKRSQCKYPVVVKFSESGWKFCFYTTMFCYGIYALHDKEYFYDIRQTLLGYPAFRIPREIYWYYMVELGYYVSEMGWIFYGVRRTDFRVLLLHHIATVGLMLFSYVANHHRIGAIVLVVHDIADCWMESAKMFKYVKKHRMAEIFFGVFMLIWVVTRLTYFPFWIIQTVLTTGFELYGPRPVYFIFVGLLSTLQVMHVFWFYLICQIALQVKTDSKKAKDCRSDSESSEECMETEHNLKMGVTKSSWAEVVNSSTPIVNHSKESNGVVPHSNEPSTDCVNQRHITASTGLQTHMNGK
ncbi:LAG1 longevity assurance 4 [Fasciolopsis buskii]|uniref:LAG1 longevity assurance 4 n=1 Tax=Fasciolopsis buskii TaxID=27845 RepID=A0A8E0RWW9_9TREM|nr:LAG1 longevity assurance 4 [Fasciolopsis buski]